MKYVINKKIYNTETSEIIATYDNGYGYSDFNWCEEVLYKTKKGTFFLVGEGGPISQYSKAIPGGFTSGKRIEILSQDEVLQWLERRGKHKVASELFELEEG